MAGQGEKVLGLPVKVNRQGYLRWKMAGHSDKGFFSGKDLVTNDLGLELGCHKLGGVK